ncbi:hypothetical protein Q1695_002853 [Nippostrongylus brasiliensis]|nr:hypothetical protein Q1695_002853 [Nippostrongylus brasiliensis]
MQVSSINVACISFVNRLTFLILEDQRSLLQSTTPRKYGLIAVKEIHVLNSLATEPCREASLYDRIDFVSGTHNKLYIFIIQPTRSRAVAYIRARVTVGGQHSLSLLCACGRYRVMHFNAYLSSPSSSSGEDECVSMEESPRKLRASSSHCNSCDGEPPCKQMCLNDDEDPFGLDDFFVRVCGRPVAVRDHEGVSVRLSHSYNARELVVEYGRWRVQRGSQFVIIINIIYLDRCPPRVLSLMTCRAAGSIPDIHDAIDPYFSIASCPASEIFLLLVWWEGGDASANFSLKIVEVRYKRKRPMSPLLHQYRWMGPIPDIHDAIDPYFSIASCPASEIFLLLVWWEGGDAPANFSLKIVEVRYKRKHPMGPLLHQYRWMGPIPDIHDAIDPYFSIASCPASEIFLLLVWWEGGDAPANFSLKIVEVRYKRKHPMSPLLHQYRWMGPIPDIHDAIDPYFSIASCPASEIFLLLVWWEGGDAPANFSLKIVEVRYKRKRPMSPLLHQYRWMGPIPDIRDAIDPYFSIASCPASEIFLLLVWWEGGDAPANFSLKIVEVRYKRKRPMSPLLHQYRWMGPIPDIRDAIDPYFSIASCPASEIFLLLVWWEGGDAPANFSLKIVEVRYKRKHPMSPLLHQYRWMGPIPDIRDAIDPYFSISSCPASEIFLLLVWWEGGDAPANFSLKIVEVRYKRKHPMSPLLHQYRWMGPIPDIRDAIDPYFSIASCTASEIFLLLVWWEGGDAPANFSLKIVEVRYKRKHPMSPLLHQYRWMGSIPDIRDAIDPYFSIASCPASEIFLLLVWWEGGDAPANFSLKIVEVRYKRPIPDIRDAIDPYFSIASCPASEIFLLLVWWEGGDAPANFSLKIVEVRYKRKHPMGPLLHQYRWMGPIPDIRDAIDPYFSIASCPASEIFLLLVWWEGGDAPANFSLKIVEVRYKRKHPMSPLLHQYRWMGPIPDIRDAIDPYFSIASCPASEIFLLLVWWEGGDAPANFSLKIVEVRYKRKHPMSPLLHQYRWMGPIPDIRDAIDPYFSIASCTASEIFLLLVWWEGGDAPANFSLKIVEVRYKRPIPDIRDAIDPYFSIASCPASEIFLLLVWWEGGDAPANFSLKIVEVRYKRKHPMSPLLHQYRWMGPIPDIRDAIDPYFSIASCPASEIFLLLVWWEGGDAPANFSLKIVEVRYKRKHPMSPLLHQYRWMGPIPDIRDAIDPYFSIASCPASEIFLLLVWWEGGDAPANFSLKIVEVRYKRPIPDIRDAIDPYFSIASCTASEIFLLLVWWEGGDAPANFSLKIVEVRYKRKRPMSPLLHQYRWMGPIPDIHDAIDPYFSIASCPASEIFSTSCVVGYGDAPAKFSLKIVEVRYKRPIPDIRDAIDPYFSIASCPASEIFLLLVWWEGGDAPANFSLKIVEVRYKRKHPMSPLLHQYRWMGPIPDIRDAIDPYFSIASCPASEIFLLLVWWEGGDAAAKFSLKIVEVRYKRKHPMGPLLHQYRWMGSIPDIHDAIDPYFSIASCPASEIFLLLVWWEGGDAPANFSLKIVEVRYKRPIPDIRDAIDPYFSIASCTASEIFLLLVWWEGGDAPAKFSLKIVEVRYKRKRPMSPLLHQYRWMGPIPDIHNAIDPYFSIASCTASEIFLLLVWWEGGDAPAKFSLKIVEVRYKRKRPMSPLLHQYRWMGSIPDIRDAIDPYFSIASCTASEIFLLLVWWEGGDAPAKFSLKIVEVRYKRKRPMSPLLHQYRWMGPIPDIRDAIDPYFSIASCTASEIFLLLVWWEGGDAPAKFSLKIVEVRYKRKRPMSPLLHQYRWMGPIPDIHDAIDPYFSIASCTASEIFLLLVWWEGGDAPAKFSLKIVEVRYKRPIPDIHDAIDPCFSVVSVVSRPAGPPRGAS